MSARPFLTAQWRYLAILNYEVDETVLAPFVPKGVALDLWENKTLVSIVGFRFLNTKVLGIPLPGHRNFDEVNLRFYVKRRLEDGTFRRGVVFIREIVPRRLVAAVARIGYGEPYVRFPMRHSNTLPAERDRPARILYGWKAEQRWQEMEVTTEAVSPSTFASGSEEEFITEHYWGYTRLSDERTAEYQVDHPPWRVWKTASASLNCDVGKIYGDQFTEYLSGPPRSAMLAEGSEVTVFRGRVLAFDPM